MTIRTRLPNAQDDYSMDWGSQLIRSTDLNFDLIYAQLLQLQNVIATGSTASRPTSPANGFFYLDTTLGIPIWALSTSGTGWINAAGFAV